MNFLENFFGGAALITTIIGIIPQIYKAFKTKSTQDISMLMLWNCFACALSWLIYGLLTKSEFVIWSNAVGLIVAVISILQKRYYDGTKKDIHSNQHQKV
jgi:MtN3 and saliva related transmembrane protein